MTVEAMLGAVDSASGAQEIFRRTWVRRSGIPASRIRVVGYGASRPLMLNTGDGNRAINRRLELYFHRPDADIGL